MIASLPMYARPHNRAAHDALWALIRDGLRERDIPAPDSLTHDSSHDGPWSRPDLVLGQICNLPYRTFFQDRLTIIGASHYDLPETQPGYYHSVYVVRHDDAIETLDDAQDHKLAFNDAGSQSGWGAAFDQAQRDGRRLLPYLQTGAHRDSLAAVATGDADIACIDAVSWWMDKNTAHGRALRVLDRSHATPGQSFVTAGTVDPAPYFDAITSAIETLPALHKTHLGLRGIVALPARAYDFPLPKPPKLLVNAGTLLHGTKAGRPLRSPQN